MACHQTDGHSVPDDPRKFADAQHHLPRGGDCKVYARGRSPKGRSPRAGRSPDGLSLRGWTFTVKVCHYGPDGRHVNNARAFIKPPLRAACDHQTNVSPSGTITSRRAITNWLVAAGWSIRAVAEWSVTPWLVTAWDGHRMTVRRVVGRQRSRPPSSLSRHVGGIGVHSPSASAGAVLYATDRVLPVQIGCGWNSRAFTAPQRALGILIVPWRPHSPSGRRSGCHPDIGSAAAAQSRTDRTAIVAFAFVAAFRATFHGLEPSFAAVVRTFGIEAS